MIPKDTRAELEAVYEQIMWLASHSGVTAANARSWYTHVMAEKLKRRIRKFSGRVSQAAIDSEGAALRLEHYKRIQTTLTQLVDRHCSLKRPNPDDFIHTVLDCERVHIVTVSENYAAMKANGDYDIAGIVLRRWKSVPSARKKELWNTMLRGKVANSDSYAPHTKRSRKSVTNPSIKSAVAGRQFLTLQVNKGDRHRIMNDHIGKGSLWVIPQKNIYHVHVTGDVESALYDFVKSHFGPHVGEDQGRKYWNIDNAESVDKIIHFFGDQ